MFKSQFVIGPTKKKKKDDHQGCDYKGGLLLYVTKPQVIGSM
jgi:hypothetical protein